MSQVHIAQEISGIMTLIYAIMNSITHLNVTNSTSHVKSTNWSTLKSQEMCGCGWCSWIALLAPKRKISRTRVSNSLISVDRRTDSIYVSWTLFMSSWHIYWISLFLTNSCLESHFANLLSLKLQETLSTEMSGCETWVSEIFYVCVTNSWYEFLGKITLCSIIGNTIDHNVIFPKKCRTSRTHVTNSHTALI